MAKTIIVTGASSGIGSALAEQLALQGHHVVAVGRNKFALEQLQIKFPSNVKIVIADLANQKEWLAVKKAIPPNETGVFLVHNAGIALPQFLSAMSEAKWDQHYLVNTKAVIFLTQLLLPHLKNGGRVLTVSTGLAHHALPALGAYGISKAAAYMWKEYCNAEMKGEGISFGSAMPGVVDTPIQAQLRSMDAKEFPAVEIFKGFFQRNELLPPATAAKFLCWLLFKVNNDLFIKGDWDIYDESHHQCWAMPGEVKERKK